MLAIAYYPSCADQESIVKGGGGGPTLTTVVLVDEGRENPKTIISGS